MQHHPMLLGLVSRRQHVLRRGRDKAEGDRTEVRGHGETLVKPPPQRLKGQAQANGWVADHPTHSRLKCDQRTQNNITALKNVARVQKRRQVVYLRGKCM